MNTHYDGNDDHLPIREDTLEPGDVDKNGSRDVKYEEAQTSQEIEAALNQRPF